MEQMVSHLLGATGILPVSRYLHWQDASGTQSISVFAPVIITSESPKLQANTPVI